jgi:16S rRNA (cytosine967-C5)-methyltransferase
MLALRVLSRVEQVRAYADLSLHAALARSTLAPADRALATELVYGTLRWRGRLDFLLSHVSDRVLDELDPLVRSTLRVGAYQLVFSDRIPASAAVDESVRCIQAAGAERASGFVNAVLRRLAAEHGAMALPTLVSDPLGHLVHALSLPTWLAERWLARFGPEEAAALAEGLNRVPPRSIRVNRLRGSREALLAELRERHPDAAPCLLSPDGIVLGRRGDPGLDPAFREGRFTVQDEASQLVVELLDPQPGERVLDACAAPGAKATAIAERVGPTGRVLALDRHERRLGLLLRDVRRLGLENVAVETRDAAQPLPERLVEGGFDRVLVDAPCSGMGALRRNPDARWRVQPEDVPRLAELQQSILRGAASSLRPGGTLVYSTCTLLSEENEAVVEAFLRTAPSFRLVPRAELPASLHPVTDERGFMRLFPHRNDTDGFFAARLERRA